METKELTEKDADEKEKLEKVMQKKVDAIVVEGHTTGSCKRRS